MSHKKNIDRLFQEKLKDFEAVPNDAVWSRISDNLPNKKKKRRVIALWWQIGGVAAVIALLLTVGGSVFNSNIPNNTDLPIVDVEKTEEDNNINGNEASENTTINNDVKELITNGVNEQSKVADLESETTTSAKEKNKTSKKEEVSHQLVNPNKAQRNQTSVANNTSNQKENNNTTEQAIKELSTVTNEKATKVASNTDTSDAERKTSDGVTVKNKTDFNNSLKKELEASKNAVVENTAIKTETKSNVAEDLENTNSVIEEATKESILDAIAENSKPIDEKEEEKQNRWSIAPNVAPVYFNTLGQGSSLDTQFSDNAKSGDVNMSYGVAGSYAITKRLRVRTGISQVNLNQQTSDVFAFAGPNPTSRGIGGAQYANIKFKNGAQPVTLMSSKMFNRTSTPELFNTTSAGAVDQRFGFLEVPLELEYRLLDKKFGVNVIGGFSTFFLNNNEIYADIDGNSTLIGEATNINGTSFSANFGLGMDYSLSKQWNINLEPTFKYQLNTFNNTSGNFRPFFIGVYTGLSFKF